MTCEQARSLIDVASDQYDLRASEHLHSCSSCRQWLRQMRLISDGLRRMDRALPSEGFERRVRIRIQERSQRSTGWLQALQSLIPPSAPELIASAVLIVIMVALLYSNLSMATWLRDGYASWLSTASDTFHHWRTSITLAVRPQSMPVDTLLQWLPIRWFVVIGIAGALLIHRMIERTSRFAT